MHEISVAQSILEVVREYVPDERAAALTVVRVRVGNLSGVVPESLAFCFGALVADTPFGGARLDIERVAAECACGGCGARFAPAERVFLCPACGGGDTRLVAGADLDVVHVELAESGTPAR
jgi:hydrogenase nickel incorporation protein HypA/HybF